MVKSTNNTSSKETKRRRTRGEAWHWKQTDCWYFTPPGTKRRVRLLDEQGRPIRGISNRQAAALALARVKVNDQWRPETDNTTTEQWLVAKICSAYLENLSHREKTGGVSEAYLIESVRYLNSFCEYCGALNVSELRKGHVEHWIRQHPTWRSTATQRNAATCVMAAFFYASEMYGQPNPLKGFKKPPQKPKLHSFTPEEEELVYAATDQPFREFLFAAVHTGLRPFSELARLSTDHVIETDRGMMWRVHATKNDRVRVIPVRSQVAALTRQLIDSVPDESKILFRNSQGNPWKKVTGVRRFVRMREKLGWRNDPQRGRYSTYTCRHTFAHRMLAGYWNNGKGCTIEVLAELMGDTPKVAFDHYGKEWGQHYQDPLWRAIGVK